MDLERQRYWLAKAAAVKAQPITAFLVEGATRKDAVDFRATMLETYRHLADCPKAHHKAAVTATRAMCEW